MRRGFNIKEALRALKSAPFRSTLALLGIVAAISSITAMIAVTSMVKAKTVTLFEDMGTNELMISWRFDEDKFKQAVDYMNKLPVMFPEIIHYAPFESFWYGEEIGYDGERIKINELLSVTTELFPAMHLTLDEGRFLHDLDRSHRACMVGADIAERLKKRGADKIVGSQISFKGQYLKIVGVLKKTPAIQLKPKVNRAVLVSQPLIRHLFGGGLLTSTILTARLSMDKDVDLKEFKALLESYFTKDKSYMPAYLKGRNIKNSSLISIIDMGMFIDKQEKQGRIITRLLGLIGTIFMVVGGTVIMNMMLVSITERRWEIGLRRALGAQKLDIYIQFLAESVFLCLLGGISGTATGLLLAKVVAASCALPFFVPTIAVWAGCGIAIAAGLFFGVYPAHQAAKLNPAQILRTE
jgi:putative ABC transport system permease protein